MDVEDSLKLYQKLDLEANVKASPINNLKVRINGASKVA